MTWAEIPNTQIFGVMDQANFYPPYNPQSILDYSGGDLVRLNGVLGFVITGGGHASTPDNSTIFVPFDSSGPRQLQGPYVSPDGIYQYDIPYEVYKPVGVWTDARKSVHTYSSILTIEKNGLPFLFLYGGSLHQGGGGGTEVTRLFNLSQTRAQAMARPDLGWQRVAPAPAGPVASSSGWDPVQKRVVTRSRSFVGAYYPDENRWEDWNINPNATFCCDFQASVAMDLVGRKMYVLGDRLAEMYDLDTKAYTDISGKPWTAQFVQSLDVGGSGAGPGVSWHERTRQIVVWASPCVFDAVGNLTCPSSGNTLLLINPATDVVKSVTMGGVTVTPQAIAGTYGRFRVIPGTDQVVLLNSVHENAFIGTVPFDDVPPPPPPPLSLIHI